MNESLLNNVPGLKVNLYKNNLVVCECTGLHMITEIKKHLVQHVLGWIITLGTMCGLIYY